MLLLVGLTGGIGTGKSAVTNILRKKNYTVIDTDKIARAVVEPGKKAHKRIKEEFGIEYFKDDDQLDRVELGAKVFADSEMRRKLNEITHPEIIKEVFREIMFSILKLNKIVFLDVPLLYETKMQKFVCKVAVTSCAEEIQMQRIIERDGLTENEAKQRINAQMSMREKVKRADFVILNNGTIDDLEREVNDMLRKTEWEWSKLLLKFCLSSAIFVLTSLILLNYFKFI
uniref:Dephospho-CoA kinase n=1 Tax=Meloidogyne incognita TaxID=6306 RepID=A0A914MIQ4_MELIC